VEPIGEGRRPNGRRARGRCRQVDDEKVHRPTPEQRPGHREALVDRPRREHDEPVEGDPAGDRLDRVEAAREVDPGDDRAGRLRLRRQPQRERRTATRIRTAQGERGGARHAARTEDRVELREPGPDDPPDVGRARRRVEIRQRHRRERADDLADGLGDRLSHPLRSCRTPPRPKSREGRRHVWREGRHGGSIIEHLFYLVNPRDLHTPPGGGPETAFDAEKDQRAP